MDLTELGSVVAEQMDALERDSPEGSTIFASLTCVVIRDPEGNAVFRVRTSVPEDYRNFGHKLLLQGVMKQALEDDWL